MVGLAGLTRFTSLATLAGITSPKGLGGWGRKFAPNWYDDPTPFTRLRKDGGEWLEPVMPQRVKDACPRGGYVWRCNHHEHDNAVIVTIGLMRESLFILQFGTSQGAAFGAETLRSAPKLGNGYGRRNLGVHKALGLKTRSETARDLKRLKCAKVGPEMRQLGPRLGQAWPALGHACPAVRLFRLVFC